MIGIEPTYIAWKAIVLPLNYTRNNGQERIRTSEAQVQQIYSLPPLATWVPALILLHLSRLSTQNFLWKFFRRLRDKFGHTLYVVLQRTS